MCLPKEVKMGSGECKSTCPADKAIYKQTCISTCPPHTKRLETDLARYCVVDNEFSCLGRSCGGDFPYCYQANCVNACPEYTVTYNKTCMLECPADASYVTADQCPGICLVGRKICSLKCPETHPYVFHSESFHYCLQTCPDFTAVSFVQLKCSTKCPPYAPYLFNNTCHNVCPDTHMLISIKASKFNVIPMCSQLCPDQTVIDGNMCVEFCPSGKHLLNKTCVEKCPKSNPILYPRNQNFIERDSKGFGRAAFMCVKSCKIEENIPWIEKPDAWWYPGSRRPASLLYKNICQVQCPTSARFDLNGICVEFCPNNSSFLQPTFGTTLKCVSSCKKLYFNKTCMDRCPNEAKFTFNKTCYKACPNDFSFQQIIDWENTCVNSCPHFIFGKKCVSVCPNNAKYQNNVTCVSKCDGDLPFTYTKVTGSSYYKQYSYLCVESCPNLETLSKDCVDNCPKEAKYIHNSTCVSTCYESHPYAYKQTTSESYYPYHKHTKYICMESCPTGTLLYNDTECVISCPSDSNFAFNESCYNKCPESDSFKGKKGSYYQCIDDCPLLQTVDKYCVNSCPSKAKYNLNGTCVNECNNEYPLRFSNYTNIRRTKLYFCLKFCLSSTFYFNGSCVTSCPEDTFIFNSSCVYECPNTDPMNYTRNGKSGGIYQCVESCPDNTYLYNGTCFDKCPKHLRTHIITCTEKCPSSHPYIDIQEVHTDLLQGTSIKKCMASCPNDKVVNEDFCDEKCPTDKPYLEKQMCVNSCQNPHSVYEITNQGKKCHNKCPNHLLLMEDVCVEKCPDNKLIVESSCKSIDKCPYHTYLEHSDIGKRCTNKCSAKFYLDGVDCVKKCPQQKVIAGIYCLDECPLSLPLSHKDFSSKPPRVHCYDKCPSDYVANGTECIESYKCTVKNHFTYNYRCYKTCPHMTIEYGYKSCYSMDIYITLLAGCVLFIIIPIAFIYITTCFTGWSHRRKEVKTLIDQVRF